MQCIRMNRAFSILLACLFIADVRARAVLDEQSETCTPRELTQEIQCLRELPAERYEVLEGEDVQMRCRVANQKGKAQWRAGNFLLGYVRSIPSWPRYSIHGEARYGVHDLFIQNVSHEDAGTFECQISPADGYAPLRRQTILSILIKPSQPTIVAPSGEPQPTNDGQLIVLQDNNNNDGNKSHIGSSRFLRLFCRSQGGRPAPKFEWFHNGIPILTHESVDESDPMSTQGASSRTSVSNGRDGEEHTAELQLARTTLSTGDRLICLVSNKATLRSKQLSQQKLRSELYVIIHSPPGDPQIIDWSNRPNQTHVFEMGNLLGATCRVQPAGNPPGELSWRWERRSHQSSVQTQAPLFSSNPSEAYTQTLSAIPSEQMVQQFTENSLLIKVRIPKVNATQHGLQLVCAVKHQVGPEKTARVTVLVRHGPKAVHIHGPLETSEQLKRVHLHSTSDRSIMQQGVDNEKDRNTIYHVYHDRPQYLICLSEPFFDRATITWYGMLNVTGQWQPLTPVETMTLEFGVHSRINASIVQLVSTNKQPTPLRWTAVKCQTEFLNGPQIAGNEIRVEKEIRLETYEPPGKPAITGYDRETLFQEGTKIILTCEARPGRPAGYLLWITDLEKPIITNATTNRNLRNRMWATMELTMSREINGMTVRCAAINEGYKIIDTQTSFPIQLGVAYSATTINMTISDALGRPLRLRDRGQRPRNTDNEEAIYLNTTTRPPTITADEGTPISVTCQVDLSNPKPRIQWRLYRCPPELNNTENVAMVMMDKQQCPVVVLAGTDDSSASETTVRSRISISLNWTHHADMIECFTRSTTSYEIVSDASHSNSPIDMMGQPMLHKRVRFNIRFKPTITGVGSRVNRGSSPLVGMETIEHQLPQYIAVEGGSVELKLEPLSNPAVIKLVWFKNNRILRDTSPELLTDALVPDRFVLRGGKLQIRQVHVADMGNYTMLATNQLGSTRFRFFLNVTYGPQLIGASRINITASGKKAELECQARANPTPSEHGVHWRRLSHSFSGLDVINHLLYPPRQSDVVIQQTQEQTELPSTLSQAAQSEADSITGIRCNKGQWHNGFKYFAKCWSPSSGILASSLIIYDLGPSDVGRYQCHIDNAIGSPVVRIVDLIYPFAPKVVPIPRWARTAPGYDSPPTEDTPSDRIARNDRDKNNSSRGTLSRTTRLTCVIAAEPKPEVEWTREPSNLTLVEGGQFRSEIRPVHPGLYHATLYLDKTKDTDLGRYFCKARNLVGQDTGRVDLIKPSRPDQPSKPRLINATSNSLAVSWTQAFNGGPRQRFQLRWAPNDNPEMYEQAEIAEDFESESITFIIPGLQKVTTYRVIVNARNEPFGTTSFTQYMLASTKAQDPIPDEEAMRDEARAKSLTLSTGSGRWDLDGQANSHGTTSGSAAHGSQRPGDTREDRAVFVIVGASVFGCLVLVGNLLIILLLAHRKRRKLSQRRKHSIFTGNDPMQFGSTRPSYADLGGTYPRPTYAGGGYTDGASMNEDMSLRARSMDQPYPQFATDMSPVNVGPVEQHSSMMAGTHSFTGSPHPSIQATNPLAMHVSGHVEYNPGLRLPTTGLTKTDMSGMTYLDNEVNSALVEFNGYSPFAMAPRSNEVVHHANTNMMTGMEQRTPLSLRLNTTTNNVFPVVHRVESPNSGTASNISGTGRCAGAFSNNIDLNGGYFMTPRTPSQHNMSSLSRQPSFGQYTPNGTFGRNLSDYGQPTSMRNGLSSFTPTQTLLNARTRTNPMVSSYYVDPTFNQSASGYPDTLGQTEMMPAMGTCQLVRRGSYNTYKPQENSNLSSRMHSAQLLDTYLQRYNDQLQHVRQTMGQQQQHTSPSRPGSDLDGQGSIGANYRAGPRPIMDMPSTADGLIIPPPNAFGSASIQPQYSPQALPMDYQIRSVYHNAAITQNEGIPMEDIPNTGSLQSTGLAAPVKHPTPNQALLLPTDRAPDYPRYGCMV